MGSTQLTLAIDGPIARATFSTPAGLNVLSGAVLDQVHEVCAQVQSAADVRALVVAATGKVFVAGADITELKDLDGAGAAALAERGNRAFDALAALPCMTIARLHGAALGGGFEVALACDFRVAIRSAKIGLPETALGVTPGWRGISRAAALIGPARTKRLVFSATPITAERGHAIGLVDELADDDNQLDVRVAELIAACRRGGPHAIAQVKLALRTGADTDAFAACFDHPESSEGLAAFLDKRTANWMEG